MWFQRKSFAARMLVLSLLAIAPGGCEKSDKNPVVRAGDEALVQYTCRVKGGGLVATTYEEVAEDASLPRSPLFVPNEAHQPSRLKAGPQEAPKPGIPPNLMQAMTAELSEAIVGTRVGKKRTVELSAEVPPGLPDGERFLEMARVRKRDKQKTMTTGLYERFQEEKKAPSVGQQVILEPGFTGTVSSVAGDQVTLRVEAKPGGEVETLFGKGVIQDKGDHYEIEIGAREGSLVRLGNLVGRIVEVDDTLIKTDFGHPFGGESLICEVTVEGIDQDTPAHDRKVAQEGDRVEVKYALALEGGTEVAVDSLQGSRTAGTDRAGGAEGSAKPVSEVIVAGSEKTPFGLGVAVLGMVPGGKKELILPTDLAYGPWDPTKQLEVPRVRREPRSFRLSTEDYAKKIGAFPAEGEVVSLLPYFKSRVVKVSVQESVLENIVTDGEVLEDDFGTTVIRTEGDEIVLTLTPKVGAPFIMDGREGRVTSSNERTFTVDFNHPLAGKTLFLELEVVSITQG